MPRRHVLHEADVLIVQLVGLTRLMVHPVPDDMGVIVRLPCRIVIRIKTMPLVTMEMYLYGSDTETLSAKVGEMLQLLHGGVCLAHHDALTQGSTAGYLGYLARLLVDSLPFLGLHGPTRLFLHHSANGIVILPQGHIALQFRCPRLVLRYQVFPDIKLLCIDVVEICLCPLVVCLTLPDIAGLDVY